MSPHYHEGTQLAIACRLTAESVNYVFQDRPWLSPGDVAATTLRWSSLQGEGVPPLPQVLWHHEALTVAFLATEDSLPQAVERMRYVQKRVSVREIHLVVLYSTDRPLYDRATFFKEKAPWAYIEMAKLSRPLSGVGGRSYYAWHICEALRVVTDSRYVYDGILKHLRRWRLQGRPFLNSDLWLLLQAEVDARVAPTLWRHVYSHIGAAGNERADELANQGRLAHPRRRQFLRDQVEAARRSSVVVRTACHTP